MSASHTAAGNSGEYTLELRSKSVLTAVGAATCLRPYYLCDHCHHGQECDACWPRSAMKCLSSQDASRWSLGSLATKLYSPLLPA
jgi:hypothetical protein